MYTVKFQEVYGKKERTIDRESPEIRFMQEICRGDGHGEAAEYFNEYTMYGKQVFLDAPNGHFDGTEGIQMFMDAWLTDFKAERAEVVPVVQTRANGRSVTEMEVWFYGSAGEIQKVPMVVFGDLIGKKLEGMRIYFFYLFLEKATGYRKPIFRPRVNSYSEPALLTGCIRAYYEQLNNFHTEAAIENILNIASDDVKYGGYRPEEVEPLYEGKEDLRKMYEMICADWPRNGYIRFETITDDGITCAAEWTVVLRKEGLAKGFVSFCGCACYERDEDGRLWSIRICDNNGCELGIDPNSIPQDLWFVE